MSNRKPSPWLIAAVVGGVLYPLLTYFCRAFIPSLVFVLLGVALIGMRILGLAGQPETRVWRPSFLVAAVFLILLVCVDQHLAVLAYPVLISLSVASIFGFSLLFPPTIVERIARLSEPSLPPEGIRYTRRVTIVWFVFLLANAAISAATALWGTLQQWTLWNGLLSYLLMGTLFICELIVRKQVRR